jgi:hypothetical protein
MIADGADGIFMNCTNDPASRSKGIDHLEKRKLIEICVAGANSSDAVFTHKDSGVRVVEQVTGKMRQLQNNLFGDVGVPFCRDKTERPGEASSAATKFHAAGALHGRRMTRRWVVTRRNS